MDGTVQVASHREADSMTTKRLASVVGLLVSVLGACATQYVIPKVSRPQSSAIGIEISLGTFASSPRQVYFAKIDDKDSLLQQGVYLSNYVSENRIYFLNARPGTYVAVAAHQAGNQQGSVARYTTYFSKELVELTKVTVHESQFAFMGSFVVNTSSGLEGADEVQSHYRSAIGVTADLGSQHSRGTLGERRNDETARNQFLLRAKEDFAGSAWAEKFK
jgi:hypothetical protein